MFFSKEFERYRSFQATKTVQLSLKIDLIAAISAHISIQDILGLDSLTPLPQVHASYKETLLIVHPDKNNGVVVDEESQAFQKFKEAFKVFKDTHDTAAVISWPIHQRPRAAALSAPASALGLRRPLGLLPNLSLMGPCKVPLLHLTTTVLVTVSLQRTMTPFTIGMRDCNFLVTRRFPGSFLNFSISLLHPHCLWERITQNSRVA